MTTVEPATTAAALEAEAAAFEAGALATVTGVLAEQVAAAVAAMAAARVAGLAAGTVGDTDVLPAAAAARVRQAIVEALGAITPDMRPDLERQVAIGVDLGRRHAAISQPVLDDLVDELIEAEPPDDLLEDEPEAPPGDAPDLDVPDPDDLLEDDGPELDLEALADADPDLADVIDSIDARAKERLDEAVALAESLPMSTQGDVDAVTTQANAVVHGARRDTAWATERAQSVGAQAEADETTGGALLWISERWSCLHCQALSGKVAHDGENFPDVSYAAKPLDLPLVPYPPRHPGCRCRVRPYAGPGPTRDMSADDPASALAREARRSVLRGWSAYDSRAARLRAAEALIEQGADLPTSVVDRAKRNVAAGEFARDNGKFPSG